MHSGSTERVTPMSLAQKNSNQNFPESDDLRRASDKFLLPELIPYDTFEKKSVQQLLYECAQERSELYDSKWKNFTNELDKLIHSNKYSEVLVKNLDDKKEWAALHYAVFNNNEAVCDLLTDKRSDDERFRCDINILTGNGENVLHIAARSNFLWQTSPSSNHSTKTIVLKDEYTVGLPDIIGTLIERGADVNHADDEGRTPLHLAVMENRLPFVKYLLSRNADIYARTKLNFNVLHFTFIPNGQTRHQLSAMFEYIRKILKSSTTGWSFPWRDKQTNLAQMRTVDNRTPLVLAVCHPAITENIIEKLLYHIGNITEPNVYQTQIFIAIEQVARRRLKDHGHLSPIYEVCNAGMLNQLFHFPCRYDNLDLLTWLIEQSSKFNGRTALYIGASNKFDLNKPDRAGYTPLLTAVFYGSTECVQHLLKYSSATAQTSTTTASLSVNIDQMNADGENILHICAKHHVSNHLFDIIWGPSARLEPPKNADKNGNLPLHVIAENNQTDMFEKLFTKFKWSTDLLSMKNNQGQTAAHVATVAVAHRIGPERHQVGKHEKEKQHAHEASKEKDDDDDDHDFGLPILELMWKFTQKAGRTGGLFEKDDDRKTCLHLAAANNQMKIVKFLVETVHLETDAIADRRLTPLHLACENGHEEIIAYLIEHGASPTFRNAELYNSLEIAIMNQKENVVKDLLTLPNWRALMRNAQPIYHSEAYDTPMRKLIRYLPEVAVWMIEHNLTRSFGGQRKHVFKKVYDYEFYMDVYWVKQWYRKDVRLPDEDESFSDRWDRRGCTTLCCYSCCCQPKWNEKNSSQVPYTDDAYTLIRNHPLFIASEQSQCPALVEHPYNTFLRGQWFGQNTYLFYVVRAISFILYSAFVALWTAIILLGKHPQYFFAKVGRNMTFDLDSCANVSRILTAANDPEALKTTTYKNLIFSLYAFLILFLVENIILIFALFPRVFRTIDYILEISAFVLTFVYIYDWNDWQYPINFRCPIQYQVGSMGLLLAWLSMLTYVKRTTWFNMGVFVAMIQLIGFKFLRFIPVLLIIVCGFGFTYWMLLQNQSPFQSPVEAVIRTGLLMFELNYEDHLYKDQFYYPIIYFVTILTAIVFSIFILNLLISVAVGEIPSLTDKGKSWQSQMLYDLLSDYSIVSLQLIRFINYITCNRLGNWLTTKRLKPITIREHNQHGEWYDKAWKYAQRNFFEEKIQDDIIPNINTSDDIKKDEK